MSEPQQRSCPARSQPSRSPSLGFPFGEVRLPSFLPLSRTVEHRSEIKTCSVLFPNQPIQASNHFVFKLKTALRKVRGPGGRWVCADDGHQGITGTFVSC